MSKYKELYKRWVDSKSGQTIEHWLVETIQQRDGLIETIQQRDGLIEALSQRVDALVAALEKELEYARGIVDYANSYSVGGGEFEAMAERIEAALSDTKEESA